MISSLGAIFITDGLLAKQALALGQCSSGNPGEQANRPISESSMAASLA
jgi:hypothetical protein